MIVENKKRFQVRVGQSYMYTPEPDHIVLLYDSHKGEVLYKWWSQDAREFGGVALKYNSENYPFIIKEFTRLASFRTWFMKKYFLELL